MSSSIGESFEQWLKTNFYRAFKLITERSGVAISENLSFLEKLISKVIEDKVKEEIEGQIDRFITSNPEKVLQKALEIIY